MQREMADLLHADSAKPSLRDLLAGGELLSAPGCYDALGARLVEEAGFPAVYMTGFGSAASRLGRPDVGLMSLPRWWTTRTGSRRRWTSR